MKVKDIVVQGFKFRIRPIDEELFKKLSRIERSDPDLNRKVLNCYLDLIGAGVLESELEVKALLADKDVFMAVMSEIFNLTTGMKLATAKAVWSHADKPGSIN